MIKTLLAVLIALTASTAYFDTGEAPQTHTLSGYVSAVAVNGYVIIKLEDGTGWAMVDDGTLRVADKVVLTYSNMGTPNDIYDDEIISIIVAE